MRSNAENAAAATEDEHEAATTTVMASEEEHQVDPEKVDDNDNDNNEEAKPEPDEPLVIIVEQQQEDSGKEDLIKDDDDKEATEPSVVVEQQQEEQEEDPQPIVEQQEDEDVAAAEAPAEGVNEQEQQEEPMDSQPIKQEEVVHLHHHPTGQEQVRQDVDTQPAVQEEEHVDSQPIAQEQVPQQEEEEHVDPQPIKQEEEEEHVDPQPITPEEEEAHVDPQAITPEKVPQQEEEEQVDPQPSAQQEEEEGDDQPAAFSTLSPPPLPSSPPSTTSTTKEEEDVDPSSTTPPKRPLRTLTSTRLSQHQLGSSTSIREDAILHACRDSTDDEEDEERIRQLLESGDEAALESACAAGLGLRQLSHVLRTLADMCRNAAVPSYLPISSLIRGLRLGVSAKSRGPARVFAHLGPRQQSGVEMTGLPSFARSFANAWGVGMWLWIEDDVTATPFTLCSFLTKDLYGVSVTVQASAAAASSSTSFLFESRDADKRDGAQLVMPAVRARRWHYIHLVHSRKGGQQLQMYVDDKLVMDRALHYPACAELSSHPLAKAVLLQDFHGLTGPVLVYNNSSSTSTFSKTAKRQVSPVLAEGERREDSRGGGGAAFAEYLPEGVQPQQQQQGSSMCCLDVQGSHLGKLLPGTRAWTTLPDRDILRAVGGPLVLLPFLQLHPSKLGGGEGEDDEAVAEYLLQSVLLLASFLEAHAGNLNEFHECQGVQLLRHALQDSGITSSGVHRELIREPGRDLLSALAALTRACGVDTVGTSNEGGQRMARVVNWKLPRSSEYELDCAFVYNVHFWVDFVLQCEFADGTHGEDGEEEEAAKRMDQLLQRVVQLGAQRMQDRNALAVRKRMGVRFLLDKLRDAFYAVAASSSLGVHLVVQRACARFVDQIIAPLFAPDAGSSSTAVTREEVRVVLDFCIGAGFGAAASTGTSSTESPLRERRKTATWDEPTICTSQCALRLLVRMFAHPHNHAALNSYSLASILAVEVVAFCGIGERLRALALRVIGLSLASGGGGGSASSSSSQGGRSGGGGGNGGSGLGVAAAATGSAISSAAGKTAAAAMGAVGAGSSGAPVDVKVGFSYISTALGFAVVAKGGEVNHNRSSAASSPLGGTSGAAGSSSSKYSSFATRPSLATASTTPGSRTNSTSSINSTSTPKTPAASRLRTVDASVPPPSATAALSSVHISHDIYNALLSMTITPTSSGLLLVNSKDSAGARWKQVCSSALGEAEDAVGSDQFDLPVVVLDDAMKICNLEAIQVILDLLPHMSIAVQQRALQDLYVLLKFDLANRKSMGSIPQWQTSLGQYISSSFQSDRDVVQMGMKIWVLVLQDCVFRNEADAVLEAYWLRASIGREVSDLALNSLFEALLAQTQQVPPPIAWDALVKVAELAGLYHHCFLLYDLWVIPSGSPASHAMLIYNSTKTVDAFPGDELAATRAVRRIHRLLTASPSSSSSPAAAAYNGLVADAAVYATARVHAALGKLRRKFEFDAGETALLDACAMLLIACARYLAQQPKSGGGSGSGSGSSGGSGSNIAHAINPLIELANEAASGNKTANQRDVFLRSRWVAHDLEPGFSSLAQVTLEELSFSLNRTERDKFDSRFAKEKDRLAGLSRARQELENAVRAEEERQVFAELARLAAQHVARSNDERTHADRWSRLVRQVLLGHTIWRDGGDNGDEEEHFCVSSREDHLRRRLYLETNLAFAGGHEDAAYANTLSNSQQQQSPRSSSSKPALSTDAAPAAMAPPVFDKNEEILYVVESARLVTASYVVFGRLEVSHKHLLFYASATSTATISRARWRLDELLEIHSRRYLLRPSAIELFFLDRTTAFFAFASPATRDDFSAQVLRQKPLRLEKAFTGSLAPPAMVLKRSRLTEQWRRREMSNFDYLMKLNMIAGRTYNDLTQYFVFPWVVRDYESTVLDLSSPAVFRDLAKPVGAMNPQREQEVRERYEVFAQDDMGGMPAFHHGSHYSSAGVVLHYLVRLEPFTTLAIELQSGRFDVPDRLFHSVKDCFKSCYNSVVDCRELIPEFYYSAEVFENRDRLPLGTRQDGEVVDDVVLPAWALGSPELFCRINREALESDYVSQNLHHWIDLVFGYKQRGKEAELACNVFSHLSYEGAVDLDAIEPGKRAAVEMQILEFGQCPSQLLVVPHPRRMSSSEQGLSLVRDLLREASYFRGGASRQQQQRWQLLVWRKQFWTAPPPPPLPAITPDAVVASAFALAPTKSVRSFMGLFSSSTPTKPPSPTPPPPAPAQPVMPPPLLSITCFPDRAVLVHADLTASVVHLVEDTNSSSNNNSNTSAPASSSAAASGSGDSSLLELRLANQCVIPSYLDSSYVTTRPRDLGLVGTSLGETLRGKAADFACTQGGNLLVSSAYLDGTLRCLKLDGTKLETNLVGHRSRVTCLAQDGRYLVSGDCAGALTLWKVGGSHDSREEMLEAFGEASTKFGSHEGPLLRVERHLFGHEAGITALAISCSLGVVCSGAQDGTLVVHALLKDEADTSSTAARLVRASQRAFQGESVDLVAVSSGSGTIIAHSRASLKLCSFTTNGRVLHECHLQERLNFVEVAQLHEQDVCITGGDRTGEVCIRRTLDLQITRTVSFLKRYRGVRCCGVFPSGKYVIIGCVDGSAIVLGDGTQCAADLTAAANHRGSLGGDKQGMLVSE